MSEDNLRNELQASFRNRATLYHLIFDELRKEVGEQKAVSILKRAIYRRGQQVGEQSCEFAPKDFAGLKDAFLGIIPDEVKEMSLQLRHHIDSYTVLAIEAPTLTSRPRHMLA